MIYWVQDHQTTESVRKNFIRIFPFHFQVNTCPIDRQVFKFIIVYNRVGGHEIAREVCKQRRQAAVEDEVVDAGGEPPSDMTLCERCGCGDREEALLLCDGNESQRCIYSTFSQYFSTTVFVRNRAHVRIDAHPLLTPSLKASK